MLRVCVTHWPHDQDPFVSLRESNKPFNVRMRADRLQIVVLPLTKERELQRKAPQKADTKRCWHTA